MKKVERNTIIIEGLQERVQELIEDIRDFRNLLNSPYAGVTEWTKAFLDDMQLNAGTIEYALTNLLKA